MGNEGSSVSIESVPDMTKSSDVVVARLRDKIYVFMESKGFVKGDAKKFDVVSQSNSGPSYIDTGDTGKGGVALVCAKENCVRLFWVQCKPIMREPTREDGQSRFKSVQIS